jgi:tetratricopeptide (TPR) repeat protein
MRENLTLVDALDRIRLQTATVVGGTLDYASADRDYAALFRERGLAAEGEDPQAVADRIQGSAARAQLVAALDHWETFAPDRRGWLLEVARRAEPGAWSDRFRDPAVRRERAALEQLARVAEEGEMSPPLLAALGLVLKTRGADPVPLLTAAQRRHPADFWLNFQLGNALSATGRAEEAVGYYRVALAVRPRTSAVHNNLGLALAAKGRPDDAIQEYQKAIALDPKLVQARTNLGDALAAKGRPDDAIREYHQAIDLAPGYAKAHHGLGLALAAKGRLDDAIQEWRKAAALDPKKGAKAHNHLGLALAAKGRLDDAIQEWRKAIDLDPDFAHAHANLGAALHRMGRRDDAIEEYRRALALDPQAAKTHSNLGAALAEKGRPDDAIQEYQKALALDPKDARAHNNLGNALKEKGRLDEAIGEYRKALDLDPRFAPAHYNLGNALAAQGRLDDAIGEYRKALDLNPKHAKAQNALGQALLRQGRFAEAQAATRRCLDLLPEHDPLRKPVTEQLRLCERLLELGEKLPALLKGEAKPADAAQRLALAHWCQEHKQLYTRAARFYAEAFADQPQLAEDLGDQHRYSAACAAALAGCGQGQDADQLDGKGRARWRRQALDWLRADLAAWGKEVEKARPVVQRTLQHWQQDPDLAGLRGEAALAQLPEAERQACRKLWAEVQALLQRARRKTTCP